MFIKKSRQDLLQTPAIQRDHFAPFFKHKVFAGLRIRIRIILEAGSGSALEGKLGSFRDSK